MAKFYMTVGIPGSGKSTWLENHKEELNFTIHSSDEIRAELLGNINDQSQNELVFATLHKRIKEDLLNGKNVAYDATSLSRKRRINFIKHELRDIPCEKICVLFATPIEICKANNANRERKVPEEVIDRMIKNFEVPAYCEGWNDIQIVWWDWQKDGLVFDIFNSLIEWCNIGHNNPHHTLSIGDHMFSAYCNYMNDIDYTTKNDLIADVILIHDCGKPLVKSYINSKNEMTEVAHFYQHHSVGSYESLFYMKDNREYTNDSILFVSLLIELHMRPFLAWSQSEKSKEKDRKLFGNDVIANIELIHKYDLLAH